MRADAVHVYARNLRKGMVVLDITVTSFVGMPIEEEPEKIEGQDKFKVKIQNDRMVVLRADRLVLIENDAPKISITMQSETRL